jgi:hypothetical protein
MSIDELIAEIKRWRDILNDAATSTLTGGDASTVGKLSKMQRLDPKDISEEEKKNIERARDHLASIDELIKIARTLPEHAQEHMLRSVWNTIGATHVIASRAFVNAMSWDRVHKSTASARKARGSDRFDELVLVERDALWRRNPKRKGNASGTAKDILENVRARCPDASAESIRHSLRRQNKSKAI